MITKGLVKLSDANIPKMSPYLSKKVFQILLSYYDAMHCLKRFFLF